MSISIYQHINIYIYPFLMSTEILSFDSKVKSGNLGPNPQKASAWSSVREAGKHPRLPVGDYVGMKSNFLNIKERM